MSRFFRAVALDFDGTLAEAGTVSSEHWPALRLGSPEAADAGQFVEGSRHDVGGTPSPADGASARRAAILSANCATESGRTSTAFQGQSATSVIARARSTNGAQRWRRRKIESNR